jgi:uncharacterized membrane protein
MIANAFTPLEPAFHLFLRSFGLSFRSVPVRTWLLRIIILLMLQILCTAFILPAHAATPVVQAVLFYSPTCGHCHKVITEDLPPLAEQYGDQLQIIGIDVTVEQGQNLYQAAIKHFNIPDERLGVPTLVIGDIILVGSQEIPDQLPGLIEQGLAAGGISWPDIPGLQESVQLPSPPEEEQTAPSEANASPVESRLNSDTQKSSLAYIDRFSSDITANSLAVAVLLGMIASVFGVGYTFLKDSAPDEISWSRRVIPLLAIIGLGVALYLSYVEITQSKATCGPVGDCNSVQQSPYARLFGFLPVGTLGAAGYIAILIAWLFQQYGPDSWRSNSSLAIWAMGWFGVIFSIYLTFLEPFVIGATCMWCITSAIVMTLILWFSTPAAKAAWKS